MGLTSAIGTRKLRHALSIPHELQIVIRLIMMTTTIGLGYENLEEFHQTCVRADQRNAKLYCYFVSRTLKA